MSRSRTSGNAVGSGSITSIESGSPQLTISVAISHVATHWTHAGWQEKGLEGPKCGRAKGFGAIGVSLQYWPFGLYMGK